jgi:hypothetical protein
MGGNRLWQFPRARLLAVTTREEKAWLFLAKSMPVGVYERLAGRSVADLN